MKTNIIQYSIFCMIMHILAVIIIALWFLGIIQITNGMIFIAIVIASLLSSMRPDTQEIENTLIQIKEEYEQASKELS